jgi:hypothetical protein
VAGRAAVEGNGVSWTRPAELRAQVERLWERGVLLASLVPEGTVEATSAPPPLFPLRLILKRPTSAELVDRFDEVRDWIAELMRGRHYRVELREVRHRVLGTNTVPAQVWVETREDALALIGKARDAKRFAALVATTRERQPELLPWLARYPLKALGLAEEWPLLLDVVAWVRNRPRPGIYLRQIDLSGVHSKFIESHRAVLAELLDLALPVDAIDPTATGVGGFARRYGFREKPLRVRFRILDPRHALLPGGADKGGIAGQYGVGNRDWKSDQSGTAGQERTAELDGTAGQEVTPDQDFELTAAAFARLELGVTRVFITENEINFLAFPPLPDTMIIFGGGYGFEMLAGAGWLERCVVYYWGDIDTHGFAILDQLRAHLPHAKSFLMDRETLLAHERLWGEEPRPVRRELTRLEPGERELYDELCAGRIRAASGSAGSAGLRLEQERVAFGWVEAALERVCAGQ